MSNIPISSLPIAVALSGSEAVVMDQAGTTKTATVSLINSINPANMPTGGILGQALVKTSSVNYATAWQTVSGLGTVQSVATGTGLTGGTITVSGTLSLATISTGNVLANTTGSTAAPVPTTPSSILDVIGSTQGDVLYRSASSWNVLAPSTSGFVLTTQGASSNPIWSAAGSGSVTSVGLALPSSILTVSGSPVTTTGTLTGTLATQTANEVWAGPTTGAAATPTFRALVGADLPNPSASSLGGIQSTTGASHQWINSISTSGVPALSQPAFTDISGSVAAGQLPNPTASSLGGVQSFAAVSNQFLTQISTSGVVSAAQPAFSNLSGNATLAQLPTIGNNTLISNISGGSSTPLANGLSAVIDSSIGNTQGDVLYRSASAWSVLAPGTNGQVLTSGGAAANPAWSTVTGTGTVTSIATNNGVTGGTITSTGTIGLASIATGNVLAYTGAGSGVPVATTPTTILDVIGSTEGDILYRGASTWSVLAPGTNGQQLQTGGASSTPSWANSVTSVTAGTGLSGGTITTTGTISITAPVAASLGGTGVVSPTANTIPINQGSSAQTQLTLAAGSFPSGATPAATSGPWTLLATLSESGGTFSDTTHLTSTYSSYEIVFENILATTTGGQTLELQVHSGGTFQATSYLSTALTVGNGSSAVSNPTTFIPVGQSGSVLTTGSGYNGSLRVDNPSSTSAPKNFYGIGVSFGGTVPNLAFGGGFWNGGNGAVDGFQLTCTGASGAASGTVKIYARL